MYRVVKPLLFRYDPEFIHERTMQALAFAARGRPRLQLLSLLCRLQDERLKVKLWDLEFPNPIGLAAGFDKNALALPAWPALGFGFVEIGSITALAQPGNDKPRLFRLPQDEAIINRMGFNNDGAEVVAQRLEELRQTHGKPSVPLGINLGKSKLTPLEQAPRDYLKSLTLLWEYGDYFVINVSSPNTPGLRALQDKDKLEELLAAVMEFAKARKPILLKIAPDLAWEQMDEILALVEQHKLGLIATNTTVSREGLQTRLDQAGGLSGRPLKARSLEVLKYLHQRLQGRVPIVSVGGVFSAEDVIERLEAGASLVQLYTGLVYLGPFLLKRLNRGLLSYMSRVGIKQVSDLSCAGIRFRDESRLL